MSRVLIWDDQVFACKKCKKCFRKDAAEFEDRYAPPACACACDNRLGTNGWSFLVTNIAHIAITTL